MPVYHFMVGWHGTMQPFKRIQVTAIDTVTGERTTERTDLNGIVRIATANEARIVVHTTEDYELLGLTAIGTGPFLYDYLVDYRWATVVSNGHGAEGQVFEAFHGLEYRVYSTLQGACDHATTLSPIRGSSIAMVPGEYDELVDITSEVHITGHGDVPLDLVGWSWSAVDDAPRGFVYFNPRSGADSTLDFQGSGAFASTIRNLVINSRSGEYGVTMTAPNATVQVENCQFMGANGIEGHSSQRTVFITRCLFRNLSGYGINFPGNDRSAVISNCKFYSCASAIRPGEGTLITGNYFQSNTIDIDLAWSLVNDVRIEGNQSALTGHFVKLTHGDNPKTQGLVIANNHVDLWSGAFADLTDLLSFSGSISIFGNTGSGASGTTALVLGNVSGLMCHDNHFDAASGVITFRSGGDGPSNHYWHNSAQVAQIGSPVQLRMEEVSHGPEFKADLIYIAVHGAGGVPLTIGWPDFSVDWGGTIVDVAAGTLALDTGTNSIYVLVDGSMNAALGGFPAALHKKIADFVVVLFAGQKVYDSHTYYAPILFAAQPGSGSNLGPADAQYLVLALDGDLSAERRFVPGTALSAVDGGADGDYTLNHDQVAVGDLHTEYILASGARPFTGAADLGGNVINNVANPVLGGDAVNLNTLLDSMTISLHYHFLASNVMSSVFSAGEAFEDELITGTPQELTTIFQVSTAVDTPTPATVGAGSLISIHFDAKVLAVSGKKPVFVYVQLGYVDPDGSSNFVQIGADSDPTTVALATDKEEVELHIHVDAETDIPAGKRLKVKWWATTTGAQQNPTVHIYYGALNDHITIPISASILTNFLRKDGTTPLTANWDAGAFSITALSLITDTIDEETPDAGVTVDGVLLKDGNLELHSNAEARFYDNGNYVGFEAPALAADQIWVLPDADGNASDRLITDGAGALSWAAAGVGGHDQEHDHTTGDGSGVLTKDEHDDYSEYAEIVTPSNPAQDKFRLFARASGDSIQVVVRSSEGQEAVLATLLDGAAPPAKKMLLLGVKQ